MAKVVLFNKPFNCLSQFSKDGDHPTLAEFIDIKDIYPAGRLDRDSEGLLVLTNDGRLQHQIAHPSSRKKKIYFVELEGVVDEQAISALRRGVTLNDGVTRPARVKRIPTPDIWARNPPIHSRHTTSWVSLEITEGRNRQVRRMTAAVGFPTLRLVRVSVGPWNIEGIKPGKYRVINVNMPKENTRHPRRG